VAATLAVVTAAFPEVHAEAASQEAAFPEVHAEAAFLEVASRVEADMVVGGIKRRIGAAPVHRDPPAAGLPAAQDSMHLATHVERLAT
jgi:hypothetical protein